MAAASPASARSACHAGPAFRVAFEYALSGDLAYLSHRDELRMLRRALVRAGWPLRFSRGYNPIPWLSVPLPRRVGVASDCQLALTDLSEPRPAAWLRESLAAALPRDCRLGSLRAPAPGGTPHAQSAEYAVTLAWPAAQALAPAVERWRGILEMDERRCAGGMSSPPAPKCQQFLEGVALEGPELRLRLRFIEQRTARPSEVLTELGLAPDAHEYTVRLCEVAWNTQCSGPALESRASKGFAIGYKENHDESDEEQDHEENEKDSCERRLRN